MITKRTGFVLGAVVAAACVTWGGPMADATSQSHFDASQNASARALPSTQELPPYVAMGQTFMWPGR
jgi:hypothetical protein